MVVESEKKHSDNSRILENVIADQKSCHHRVASDWKLDPQIFSPLALRWGSFSVYLFAVRHKIFSWNAGPAAAAVNTMVQ